MATTIILFSTPFFFLLIAIELVFNAKNSLGLYRINDCITSLSLGVISQTKKLVIFGFAALVYAKLEVISGLPRWPSDSAATWIVAFIVYDLLYYWFHRTSHEINFLWASHVVHHQSEDYNLSTALRQTSSSIFGWLFYIPSFLIGIPAEVFFVCGALNLVYQFWVHTQLIGRLGWLEMLLVTPSHHRVHHGQNPEYIDKNHGGVFIIWDKLFGTFQQEIDGLPVIYGVRSAANSFNPLWLNFKTWYSLLTDAWHTKNWWDKLRIWFMPTGWRPADRLLGRKTSIIETSANFIAPAKYNPKSSPLLKGYVIFQYVVSVTAALFFIVFGSQIDLSQRWLIWLLITWPLVGNGFLLDHPTKGARLEWIRLVSSVAAMLYLEKLYFNNLQDYYWACIVGYFLLSLLLLLKIQQQSRLTQVVKRPAELNAKGE